MSSIVKGSKQARTFTGLAAPAALILMLIASAGTAAGTVGDANSGSGQAGPEATCPPGGQCFADVPAGNPFYEFVNRIYQQDLVTGYACGGAGEPCDPENRPYYRPGANVTRQQMAKFIDNARRLPEVHIEVSSGAAPIFARNDAGSAMAAYSTSGQALVAVSQSQSAIYAQTGTSSAVFGYATGSNGTGIEGSGSNGVKGTGSAIGVEGISTGGGANAGVYGHSTGAFGVAGESVNMAGVIGQSGDGIGVFAASVNDFGLYARSDTMDSGRFFGDVTVTGNLSKGGGSFKIDHPLDPANKYLYHSFVESPDMMNIYNGNVTTDGKGEAVVTLPEWFEALNKDFRYQLTVMGQFAQAIVSEEIEENRFAIRTDKPYVKVSWMVTGVRKDPYANANRIPVEEEKPADERGKYLHPEEWGRPESLGVDYERLKETEEMMESLR